MSLAAVTEISPVHLNYPNSVVVGTRINARDVGSIPTRNYHIRMKKVAVPNNYNPETRHYDGNWDGKFLVNQKLMERFLKHLKCGQIIQHGACMI